MKGNYSRYIPTISKFKPGSSKTCVHRWPTSIPTSILMSTWGKPGLVPSLSGGSGDDCCERWCGAGERAAGLEQKVAVMMVVWWAAMEGGRHQWWRNMRQINDLKKRKKKLTNKGHMTDEPYRSSLVIHTLTLTLRPKHRKYKQAKQQPGLPPPMRDVGFDVDPIWAGDRQKKERRPMVWETHKVCSFFGTPSLSLAPRPPPSSVVIGAPPPPLDLPWVPSHVYCCLRLVWVGVRR